MRIPTLWRAAALAAVFTLPHMAEPAAQTAPEIALPPVEIVGSTPLLGSGIDAAKVPAQVSVLGADDIARAGAPDLTRALNERVSGVTLDNAAGNPYQPDIFYHGFRASALQGVEQGLAVFVDGVRFNQAFGDTVNWDLIPNVAINQVNLEGSNPAFGLNAIGGALNIQLKNGFTFQGGDAEISGGSFGRIQGSFEYGKQAGNTSAYVAGSVAHENGWRDFQSSNIQNFYGDIGWRSARSELHLGILGAHSRLDGPGTAPVELLAVDPAAQFTGPNRIDNQFGQVRLNGSTQVSDTVSLQGDVYYAYFRQRVINGNVTDFGPCDDVPGFLCASGDTLLTTRGGVPVADFLAGGPYSQLDQQTTTTNGYGAAVQATDTHDLFGFKNQFVAGFSFDGAQTGFTASSAIGGLTPLTRDFIGPGVVVDQADGSIAPVRLHVSDATYGVFLADTLDLTPRLAVTLSGRFNAAQVNLSDQAGVALSGNHSYDRFNPAAGVSYRFTDWLTGFAGYAEANRAPTPAELSCASAASPCSLANFFVGDPDLKQVVSHTIEVGVRGSARVFGDTRLSYSAEYFHSDLDDDIQLVNSAITGRAFFQNVGATRRQGVDFGLRLVAPRWEASIGYAYTAATFRDGFVEEGGSNPAAGPDGTITVRPGDRLPGIPAHQVKLGLSYKVTDAWTVGATAIGTSSSFLFGDEANLTRPLPGYFVVNLRTSYRLTDNVELFGLVENVTNQRYYLFGTFSPTSSVFIAQAPGATNPRSYTIAAPVGGFGGIRVTF